MNCVTYENIEDVVDCFEILGNLGFTNIEKHRWYNGEIIFCVLGSFYKTIPQNLYPISSCIAKWTEKTKILQVYYIFLIGDLRK